MKHIIDTDKDPKIPYDGWTIESHAKQGKLDWNKVKLELYLSENQKDNYVQGEDLLTELKDKNPLNANVLEYLLDHQELIPKEWEVKFINFFGTIFKNSGGDRYVLYLCFRGGVWSRDCDWLGLDWYRRNPSALLASSALPSKNETSALDPLNLEISEILVNGRKYRLVDGE